SDESHTGEFIAQIVLKAINLIGWSHFAGVTSDNTGNTRIACQILCAEIKTLIQVPDICHHLNLLCKDITQLSMFSMMIKHLRSIITYFRKSHAATDALNKARKSMNINRGLEGIGKTRFATVCILALSLKRCFPTLRQIVDTHQVKFPSHKSGLTGLLMSSSSHSLDFESQITRFTLILAPIAKSIACLESSRTDLSDISLFYFAIGATLKQIFDNNNNPFSPEEAGQIRAIFNSQFRKALSEGPTDAPICHNPLNELMQGRD
ncbi:ribonuclease H-like domain-containing protein, partial [Suillus fuscotomentosus]